MSLRRTDHVEHFELDEILPVRYPRIEQVPGLALHHLKADLEVLAYPTRDVANTLGREATLLAKPLVNRLGVPVAESLDDKEGHGPIVASGGVSGLYDAGDREPFRGTTTSPVTDAEPQVTTITPLPVALTDIMWRLGTLAK